MSACDTELRKTLRVAYIFRTVVTASALVFTLIAASMVLKGHYVTAVFQVLIVISQIGALESMQRTIIRAEIILRRP